MNTQLGLLFLTACIFDAICVGISFGWANKINEEKMINEDMLELYMTRSHCRQHNYYIVKMEFEHFCDLPPKCRRHAHDYLNCSAMVIIDDTDDIDDFDDNEIQYLHLIDCVGYIPFDGLSHHKDVTDDCNYIYTITLVAFFCGLFTIISATFLYINLNYISNNPSGYNEELIGATN